MQYYAPPNKKRHSGAPSPHSPGRRCVFAGLGWFCCLLASLAVALPDDRNQPIKITADTATRDERAGETRYAGNVILTQGSMEIHASDLTIMHTAEQADLIVATGNPATMVQQPEVSKSPINAEAMRIEYRRELDKVTLKDNARIEQDGAIVAGAVIHYLVSEQRVQASGDQEDGGGQRVEVIIPSSALQQTPENPAP